MPQLNLSVIITPVCTDDINALVECRTPEHEFLRLLGMFPYDLASCFFRCSFLVQQTAQVSAA